MLFAQLANYKKQAGIALLTIFIAYTPVKDAIAWTSTLMEKASVDLVDISFGRNLFVQQDSHHMKENSYMKVAHQPQNLAGPQIIYTRFKFSNPTNNPVTFDKIWLTLSYQDGSSEYTTDYNLYDAHSRQRLVGNRAQIAAHSEVEVLASYRFVPSYRDSKPATLQISWEGSNQLRESSCKVALANLQENNFGTGCHL